LVGLPGQEPYFEPLLDHIEEQNGTVHEGALITSRVCDEAVTGAGFEKTTISVQLNSEPWTNAIPNF
jgi:hypothetical protein